MRKALADSQCNHQGTTAKPNPYVGPRPFKRGETLYGRKRELAELVDLLIAERIVLFHSPSGAGKSSLINAALIPRLEEEGFRVRHVAQVSLDLGREPSERVDTNRYLLSSLLSFEEDVESESQKPVEDLARLSLAEYLGKGERDVVIFDQFEEVLTLDPTDIAAKREFFSALGDALRDRGRWALFAIREDYLAALDPYVGFVPTRFRTKFRLDLLGDHAAREAMQEPASNAGVEFGDDAAKLLAEDLRRVSVQLPDGRTRKELGQHVEPVQLQVVCYELYHAHKRIDVEHVKTLRVDVALASYYARSVAEAAGKTGVQERTVREWIDEQLVTPSGIRSQVLHEPESSAGLDNRVISRLVHCHLVRAERRRGSTWYELAHDRLVDPVRDDNKRWLERNLSPFQKQAKLWSGAERPPNLLLTGKKLADAKRWVKTNPLNKTESEFLKVSKARQRVRIMRLAIPLSVVMLTMLIWALASDYYEKRDYRNQIARDAPSIVTGYRDRADRLSVTDPFAKFDRWLHEARKLKQDVKETLSYLSRHHDNTFLSDEEIAIRRALIEEFSRDDPLQGTIAWVQARLDAVQDAEKHRLEWEKALEAIQKIPEYNQNADLEGLRSLKKQLLPLGGDEKSKLWEFLHLRTQMVLVLIPGDAKEIPMFLIGKYEVTQKQWRTVIRAPPSPSLFYGDDLPVEQVSWDDCQKFCEAAGLQLPEGKNWKHACKAGGSCEPSLLLGWFEENSDGRTHPVGEKLPNAYGLHDMHGNVREWCRDPSPEPKDFPDDRIARGGSWNRSVEEDNDQTHRRARDYDLGLRATLPLPTSR